MKDPALFWEIFGFGFSYLATVTWMGAMLVWGHKDHARRVGALEHGVGDLREDVARIKGQIEGREEVKQVVREWLSEIEKKGETR
jgi:hypothetical protein